MDQCMEHSKICGDLGGISANIINLTAAIANLNMGLQALTPPIYTRLEVIEDKVGHHASEIIKTKTVLQDYMKHQDEKERKAMWQVGITVTIINLFATMLIKFYG